MKRLTVGLLLLGAAFSSCAPKAGGTAGSPQAIFDRAKAAHGGTALDTMKSYSDIGTLSIFQGGQLAAKVGYVQKYDFSTSRVRIEVSVDGKLAVIQQSTPTDSWQWSPQAGIAKLPADQVKTLQDSLYQGFFALRAKSSEITDAKYDGRVELGKGIVGEGISFKLKGVDSSFVIGDDGLVLGGKVQVDGATVITLQSDNRVVGGVKFPFLVKQSVGTEPASEIITNQAQINVTFTSADFAQPKP